MDGIKIYKHNEKLQEAYEVLQEKVGHIIKQFDLSYFELWGIVEAIKLDIAKSNMEEEEK